MSVCFVSVASSVLSAPEIFQRKMTETLQGIGHLIDQSGIQPDSDKVEAIRQLSPPAGVQELKRILGMVNYLGRYIPDVSAVGPPLYELLKNKNTWTWSFWKHQGAADNCTSTHLLGREQAHCCVGGRKWLWIGGVYSFNSMGSSGNLWHIVPGASLEQKHTPTP